MIIHLMGEARMADFIGCCRASVPLLATLFVVLGPASSAAPQPDESVSVVVGDLDFSSPRDIDVFTRRVDKGARSLCRREGQLDFLEMNACLHAIRRQCLRQLTDGQRRELLAASSKIRMWGAQ
jgi:UrcA family protein